MMHAQDVIEVIELLQAAEIPIWLNGGWGVDALVECQTRLHDDLDLVVPLTEVLRIQQLFATYGFTLVEDELPTGATRKSGVREFGRCKGLIRTNAKFTRR